MGPPKSRNRWERNNPSISLRDRRRVEVLQTQTNKRLRSLRSNIVFAPGPLSSVHSQSHPRNSSSLSNSSSHPSTPGHSPLVLVLIINILPEVTSEAYDAFLKLATDITGHYSFRLDLRPPSILSAGPPPPPAPCRRSLRSRSRRPPVRASVPAPKAASTSQQTAPGRSLGEETPAAWPHRR